MKNIMLVIMMFFSLFGLVGCGDFDNNNVVRIHIRANSNSESDQSVKLVVRDSIISLITPLIANCSNSVEVKGVLENNLTYIENVADQVLYNNGYDYVSDAKINNEYFPSRDYNGTTFPADYYDALIVNLGTGKGDNWWCVAYPPLCFVGEENASGKVEYKSKLIELINKYFGR